MFWFFGHEAYGNLAPRPGIEPVPLHWKGEASTTGPPGKFPISLLIYCEARIKRLGFGFKTAENDG